MPPWAVEKWNNIDTKSSLSPMKHTWSFYNFCNWKLSSYFSSNVILKSLNGVYILTKALVFAFLHTSNRLMWSLGRIKVKHTCIAYIAKSNNRSMEENIIHSDQGVHVCGNVEIGQSWLLLSMIRFFLHLWFESMAFFLSLFFLFFNYGPSYVHFFLYFFSFFPILFHSPCLICENDGERSC